MKQEDVTVYRCDNDNQFAHSDRDQGVEVTTSPDDLPDGWVEVYGLDEPLTFCSMHCAWTSLMDRDKAKEVAA